MKILCVFGEHNYGDPARGIGYEYSNFLPAIKRIASDVIFFESFSRRPYRNFADLNRRLLQTVEKMQPDLIFCVLMGYEVWLETLDLIRKHSHAILLNWSTDDSWKFGQFSRLVASRFDIYATTDSKAVIKAGQMGMGNFVLSQWGADAGKLAEPLPAAQCRYQVSFIGSNYGNRSKWIAGLKGRGIEVSCFGHGWPAGPVAAEAIPQIIRQSVLSLNFGDSGIVMQGLRLTKSRQIKARIFEVPGAGGCLLTEPAANLENFFTPGKEILLFENLDALARQIRYYLDHPAARDAVAVAGHDRTRHQHTYDLRFTELFRAAAQKKKSRNTTLSPLDWRYFEKLVEKHRRGLFLELFKKILLLLCKAFWGQKRGARAARRLLFELSWRIAGKHTYSAAGLPGRLFYHES
jgi:spore maturation protein CgeB